MPTNETQKKYNDLFEDFGIYWDELSTIDTKSIHTIISYVKAYWDSNNDYLIILGSQDTVNKFLYYIGAENEGKVLLKIDDVWVMEQVDPERIENYI